MCDKMTMKKKITAVLSGHPRTYEVFKTHYYRHIVDKDKHELIYIGKREDILGRSFDDYLVLGDFWDRNDASELYSEIQHRIRGK
jgi:hypothetical protein